jgi:hypothetical protein
MTTRRADQPRPKKVTTQRSIILCRATLTTVTQRRLPPTLYQLRPAISKAAVADFTKRFLSLVASQHVTRPNPQGAILGAGRSCWGIMLHKHDFHGLAFLLCSHPDWAHIIKSIVSEASQTPTMGDIGTLSRPPCKTFTAAIRQVTKESLISLACEPPWGAGVLQYPQEPHGTALFHF